MTLTVLIVALVQTAEHNHIIGTLCLLYSLSQQFFCAAGLGDATTYRHAVIALHRIADIATCVITLHTKLGTLGCQSVERQDLLLNLQRRRASANGHHLNGILAYHEDTLALGKIEGEQVALVLQQHDTFLGNLQGCVVVTLRAEEAKGLLALHRRTIEQAQNAAYLLVEFLRGVLAFLNQSLIGQCHEIIVVGIRGTHRQSVGPRAKLQIESILDGLFRIVASSPV